MEYEKYIPDSVIKYLHDNKIRLSDAAIAQIIHYFERDMLRSLAQFDELAETTDNEELKSYLSVYIRYERKSLKQMITPSESAVYVLYVDYGDIDPIISGVYKNYDLAYAMAGKLVRHLSMCEIKKIRLISTESDFVYKEASKNGYINDDELGEIFFNQDGSVRSVISYELLNVMSDKYYEAYEILFDTYQDFPHPYMPGDIVIRVSDGRLCMLGDECTLEAMRERSNKLRSSYYMNNRMPFVGFQVFERDCPEADEEYWWSDVPEHPYQFEYI